MRWLTAVFALIATFAATGANATICPGPNVVEGIDVSVWQGTIDWKKVKASGKVWAVMRVSDGTYMDKQFDANWANSKSAGVIRGVYQYFEPGGDAIQQANILLNKMGKLGPEDLPPTLDVEATGNQSPAVIASKIKQWVDHVKAATGRDPMIYTGKWFWDPKVASGAFANLPLWHAQYCTNCCPAISVYWKAWKIWQYSSSGKVGGISGNVDTNKFNGSNAELLKFAGGAIGCKPHCEGAIIVGADCGKGDCSKFAATCVDDSIGVRCASVFCPAKGDATVCVPSKNDSTIGTCHNGAIKTGECGQFGAFCSSKAGPVVKCVSAFCAKDSKTAPVAKDVCLPDGGQYTCSATGDITKKPCAAGESCLTVDGNAVCSKNGKCKAECNGQELIDAECKAIKCAADGGTCVSDAKGARCVSKFCKPLGSSSLCMADPKNLTLGKCEDGTLTQTLCKVGSQLCNTKVAGGAACVNDDCAGTGDVPVEKDVCLDDGSRGHCDTKGILTPKPCDADQACQPGTALCVGDPNQEDGGNPNEDDASNGNAGDSGEAPPEDGNSGIMEQDADASPTPDAGAAVDTGEAKQPPPDSGIRPDNGGLLADSKDPGASAGGGGGAVASSGCVAGNSANFGGMAVVLLAGLLGLRRRAKADLN